MDYGQIKHSKIIVRCSRTVIVCTNVEKYLHPPCWSYKSNVKFIILIENVYFRRIERKRI